MVEEPETKKGHVQDEDYEEGSFDADVYTEEGREELVEEDQVDDWEEGVVKGFEEGENPSACDECGKTLVEKTDVVEEEIDDEIYTFCSVECAQKYLKKKKSSS